MTEVYRVSENRKIEKFCSVETNIEKIIKLAISSFILLETDKIIIRIKNKCLVLNPSELVV